jgi:hypothetical protein
MKKTLFLLVVFFAVVFKSQAQFVLTPIGFVDSKDESKSYIVIEFTGKTQGELFKAAQIYLSSLYANPKEILSVIDNEVISVKGMNSNAIKAKTGFVVNHFDVEYIIKFMFKDGKIRVDSPVPFNMQQVVTGTLRHMTVNPEGYSTLEGNIYVFNKKGDVKNEVGKKGLEYFFNKYLADFVDAIKANKNANW